MTADNEGDYRKVLEWESLELDPWLLIEGEALRQRIEGLSLRYPRETYRPFAQRTDNDDVACWLGDSAVVVIIHDFADAGAELRRQYPSFRSWLHSAIDDALDFD